MSKALKSSAQMVRKSGIVVVVWIVALVMATIGGVYFVEDYLTSVRGYDMVPTQHHYPWIIWIGALTPQVGQIFFAFLAADDDKRWWAWAATLVLFLVDAGTDVLFKHMPGVPGSFFATVAEVVIMYTLCSEVFLALGTGMMLELFPDVITAIRELKGRLKASREGKWGMVGGQRGQRSTRRPPSGGRQHARPRSSDPDRNVFQGGPRE